MKVIYNLSKIKKKFIRPVLAIGIFDGVHLGHQYLIRQMLAKARALKGTSIVLTFFPHPTHILRPEATLPFIVSLQRRLQIIEEMGVDVCIVIKFTKRFSCLGPEDFIKKYLVERISPQEIFVGSNFRFGKNRQGNTRLLQKAGRRYRFKTNIVMPLEIRRKTVSSSLIRSLILSGKFNQTNFLLGRIFSLSGDVVRGDGRGKTLGFPTANMDYDRLILPPRGVYCVNVMYNKKKYFGMANVGWRPSFHQKKSIIVEVHIFNFNKNIYSKKIELIFLKKMRDEKQFRNRKELVVQLQKDQISAKNILKNFS